MTDVDKLINELKNDKEFKRELRWGYLPINLKFIGSLIIVILLIFSAVSYREQKLVCNLKENTCYVHRTTYLGFKDTDKLLAPYVIKDVVFYGHRFSPKSFIRTYDIYFVDSKSNRRCVFVDIPSKNKAKKVINEIKQAFKTDKNVIEYKL